MFKVDRYKIDDEYKVHGIITDDHPDGDYTFDPFSNKETIPFWGVLCTTFWGLTNSNREFLINNYPKDKLESLQFTKFWVFWFSDGDINDQKELVFFEGNAKEHALTVQHIFNHLLEKQIDKLIIESKEEYQKHSLSNPNGSFYTDLKNQMNEQ